MRKLWKDGRIVIELNEKEQNEIEEITKKETPSNKEIIALLKQVINILLS